MNQANTKYSIFPFSFFATNGRDFFSIFFFIFCHVVVFKITFVIFFRFVDFFLRIFVTKIVIMTTEVVFIVFICNEIKIWNQND